MLFGGGCNWQTLSKKNLLKKLKFSIKKKLTRYMIERFTDQYVII